MVRLSKHSCFLALFLLLTCHLCVAVNPEGGGDVPHAPQPLGFGSEAKSSGKYGREHRSEFCPHQSFFPAAFQCLLNGSWAPFR